MISFATQDEPVLIWTGRTMLDGVLSVPSRARGVVIVAGLGRTSHHERIRAMAAEFQHDQFATLIADVLDADEQQVDSRTGHYRVDTALIASRLRHIAGWCKHEKSTRDLPIALLGTSAIAAACIAASRDLPLFAMALSASRFESVPGGMETLQMPTLLMFDHMPTAPQLRRLADAVLAGNVVTIPGGSSFLDEDAAANMAAYEAAAWFRQHLHSLTAA